MLTSKRQADNVLSHWYVLMDNFQFSTKEFYAEVQKELTARQVPGLKISKVDFFEGGALSDRRVYLRLAREEFAFDICAAPFGRAYFFSQRFVVRPRPRWPLICFIALLLAGVVVAALNNGIAFVEYYYGYAMFYLRRYTPQTPYIWVDGGILLLLFLALFIRNYLKLWAGSTKAAPSQGTEAKAQPREMPDFFGIIYCLPLIGGWYALSRKETYHRQDSRMMYHTLVTEIVKKKVEEVTAAKGVKLIRS